ncbi:hypothetical protein GRF29_19g250165 [Pseudopithomyces chartarum]|uniref:Uncharacterized protein n=1 Tax=Pseudopithomyces chartarum TaxID=1892770 RepID=A0AAN6M2C3_9PLEO|nr:hypothetical protein GRF29_19g250165 [Pseudopithomyces chartarum]
MAVRITFTTAYLRDTYTITLYHPLPRSLRVKRAWSSSRKNTNRKKKKKKKKKRLEKTISKNQPTWEQLHNAEQVASETPKEEEVGIPQVLVFDENGIIEERIDGPKKKPNFAQRIADAAQNVVLLDDELLQPKEYRPRRSRRDINTESSKATKKKKPNKKEKLSKKRKLEKKEDDTKGAKECVEAGQSGCEMEDNRLQDMNGNTAKRKGRSLALIRSLSEKSFTKLLQATRSKGPQDGR